MAVEPLARPECILHPTELQKFLKGFPLLGPDRRAFRALRRQVKGRPEDCLALWKQDERTLAVRDRVADALVKALRWRSRKFIPADPCDILFFPAGDWDGMDLLDAKYRIERECGVKLPRALLVRMKSGMTLGELVDRIVARKAALEDPGRVTETVDRSARDQMVAAVQSYMEGKLIGSQLHGALADATIDTNDATAKKISGKLLTHYVGAMDRTIAASRKDWDRFNRLLLVLQSDVEIEAVKGRRRWGLLQAVAALALAAFLFLLLRNFPARLEDYFIYAIPLFVLSMALAWLGHLWERKRKALDPFPSADSMLAVRRRVTGFVERTYPEGMRRLGLAARLRDVFGWCPIILAWLMLSPVVVLIQALPHREDETRITMPGQQ